MIDEKTAIQWAADAGLILSGNRQLFYSSEPTAIQKLITRAQNEAFEHAAIICERSHGKCTPEYFAECVRAIKQ